LHSFGNNLTVTHEEAITVPGGVDEILVMTGEDRLAGVSLSDDRNLDIPPGHISNTILQSKNIRLGENVELSLKIKSRLGRLRVLETDERKLTGVPDIGISSLGRTLLITESEPTVRWIDKTGGSSSVLGSLGFDTSDIIALGSDTGDNRNSTFGSLDVGFDQGDFLIGSQGGSLSGVTENKNGFDVRELEEELTNSIDSFIVDGALRGEGGDCCGRETTKVKADRRGSGRAGRNVAESDRCHCWNL
jgi:hypothetical protein